MQLSGMQLNGLHCRVANFSDIEEIRWGVVRGCLLSNWREMGSVLCPPPRKFLKIDVKMEYCHALMLDSSKCTDQHTKSKT